MVPVRWSDLITNKSVTKLVLSDMCKILSLLVVWQTLYTVVSHDSVIKRKDAIKSLDASEFQHSCLFDISLFSGRTPGFLIRGCQNYTKMLQLKDTSEFKFSTTDMHGTTI